MKKYISVLLFIFAFQMIAVSQNFNRLSQLISTDEISYAQAAYIAAIYTGDATENTDEKTAFEVLKQKGFVPEKINMDSKITIAELCSLFAKVTDVRGGIMFMISKKSPHYAFREFVVKKYIPQGLNPSAKVRGSDAIGLFNSLTEETK